MLGRAVSLNVAGQLGGFVVSFASAVMLARFLGPSDRGLLAIMITVATVGVALAGVGLATSAQFFASRGETRQGSLLGNNLIYGAGLALLAIPLFWLLRGPLSDWFGHGRGNLVWVLAGLLVPLIFLDGTTAGQICGRLQFGLWNVLLVVSRTVSLVAVALLVGVGSTGVAGALVATGLGSALIIVVSCVAVLRRSRISAERGLFSRQIVYGAKAQVGQLFQLLNYRLDLLLLALFGSLAGVGYYAVAQTLAELVIYLGTAFQISILPLISKLDGDARQKATTQQAVRHHSVLAVAMICANAVFAPLVLMFGYGDAFRPALVPFFVLLPAMWFLSTGNLACGDLRGRGRPALASVISGVAALVTVVANVALIPPLGVNGAAIASALAYTFFGVAGLVALSRVAGTGLRDLVVPTRADLAVYPRAARRILGRQLPEGDRVDPVRAPQPLVVGDQSV